MLTSTNRRAAAQVLVTANDDAAIFVSDGIDH